MTFSVAKKLSIALLICCVLRECSGISLDRPTLLSWYPRLLTKSEINLSNRQITDIDANTFTGLTKLRRISLNRNQLTTLSANLFAGLTNLKEISLSKLNFY